MFNAQCTWGEGEDILLSFDNHRVMLLEEVIDKDRAIHGYAMSGSTFLTLEEAKSLVSSLLWSIRAVEELDLMAKQHDDAMELELATDYAYAGDIDGRSEDRTH